MVSSTEVKFLDLCSKLEDEFAELLRIWSISHNAATTRRAYQRYVMEYIEFIRKSTWREPTIDDLNHSNLCLSYVSYLRKKHTVDPKGGYCSSTALSKLCAVKSLYKTAFSNGFISSNPMLSVPALKAAEGEPSDILEDKEVKKLLKYMDDICLKKNLRLLQKHSHNLYRTMIYTILGTGMRFSSITSLRVKDYRGNTLLIYEKRGKSHPIKINDQTSEAIRNWIEKFMPLARDIDYIFTSYRYPLKPIIQEAFDKALKKYINACGFEKKITPHSFRGTVASLLHWQGVEGRRIQSLLGHKNYNTTLRYLNRADEIKHPVTDYLIFDHED